MKKPTDAPTRILLLVEDNPADATLVREYLDDSDERRALPGGDAGEYEVIHVSRIAEAVRELRSRHVDVVLLDLRLPDGTGIKTVASVKAAASDVPIVVMTGLDDESLGESCVSAGAEDFISKSEMRAIPLRRAVGFAVSRHREAELRNAKATEEQFRSLTSEGVGTSVTAAMTGSGSIKERIPAKFAELVNTYWSVLERYLEQLGLKKEKPRIEMEMLVTIIGEHGGGPRDLIDIHVAAIERAASVGNGGIHARAVATEGRLIALEMMGLLVDYYRVGHRRR